jgi:hypothetical protein
VRDKASGVLFGFAFIRQIVDSPAFPSGSVQSYIIELIDHVARFTATVGSPEGEQCTLRESLQRCEGGEWVPQLTAGLQRLERSWP